MDKLDLEVDLISNDILTAENDVRIESDLWKIFIDLYWQHSEVIDEYNRYWVYTAKFSRFQMESICRLSGIIEVCYFIIREYPKDGYDGKLLEFDAGLKCLDESVTENMIILKIDCDEYDFPRKLHKIILQKHGEKLAEEKERHKRAQKKKCFSVLNRLSDLIVDGQD